MYQLVAQNDVTKTNESLSLVDNRKLMTRVTIIADEFHATKMDKIVTEHNLLLGVPIFCMATDFDEMIRQPLFSNFMPGDCLRCRHDRIEKDFDFQEIPSLEDTCVTL